MSSTIEQVESLIVWAQCEADRTNVRQRVQAVPLPRGGGWYYEARATNRWPRRLMLECQ